jgi:hypothetical protein
VGLGVKKTRLRLRRGGLSADPLGDVGGAAGAARAHVWCGKSIHGFAVPATVFFAFS